MEPIKHWRYTGAHSIRLGWTLCGLSQDHAPAKVLFTSKPSKITCPECRREKQLRAAVARAQAPL